MTNTVERPLNLGVVGLGMAASAMIASIASQPNVRLVAGTDTRVDLRDRFAEDFGGTPQASIEALCDDPAVEAAYIATPHQSHREHTLIAARERREISLQYQVPLREEAV
jgi:phthalate 4,5-cis-dihydrodiol dehydrogenase